MEKGMQPNKYYENKYWEIWIIKDCGATIGICGLYSLRAENVETLWLGWLGITPEFRNTGFGSIVLSWLKEKAKGIGAKTLMSYVDKNGKPLPFYKRNGFTIEGRVDDFVVTNGLNISDFEGYDDFVIKFPLG
jgi:GNAT superfamily N-acetyltransferase